VEKRFAVALSAKRKVEHPQNIHQFRDDLRNHDVPTIHVGHEDKDASSLFGVGSDDPLLLGQAALSTS
jgi:hypothetical protein